MDNEYIHLTSENIKDEHLCCIIRSRKPHSGVEEKRQWLIERMKEGHVFLKLNTKGIAFIEYAPLETAWVPIIGDHYMYIYCLWVSGDLKGKGHGQALMESCIEDAKKKGKSGLCMLGSKRQKAWLSDQSFAKKYGFITVDSTHDGYELLALSFDGTVPQFASHVKQEIDNQELTIYYDVQCPYIYQSIEKIKQYCDENEIPISLIKIKTLQQAKELPCVFNNYSVFYKGQLKTVNILDVGSIKRIIKKEKSI